MFRRKHTEEEKRKTSLSMKAAIAANPLLGYQKGSQVNLGRHHTAEAKEKMSESHMGHTWTEQQWTKFKETSQTLEYIEMMHKKNLGRVQTPEHRLKNSLANKGRPKSEETKLKIRMASLGKVISIEQRRDISNTKRGENKPTTLKGWRWRARADYRLSNGLTANTGAVHHLDHDPSNNSPDNIYHFRTRNEHQAYHMRLRNFVWNFIRANQDQIIFRFSEEKIRKSNLPKQPGSYNPNRVYT
jgi:hypothetical protein